MQHHPTWFFIKGGTQYTCKCDKCLHEKLINYGTPYQYMPAQQTFKPFHGPAATTWLTTTNGK